MPAAVKFTTCAKCHRAIEEAHGDKDGLCVFCRPASGTDKSSAKKAKAD